MSLPGLGLIYVNGPDILFITNPYASHAPRLRSLARLFEGEIMFLCFRRKRDKDDGGDCQSYRLLELEPKAKANMC